MTTYNPEASLQELRNACRSRGADFEEMARVCARVVGRMRELWPDPGTRETAAVTAAAALARLARPGGEASILNCVGLIGLALVDQARAELAGDTNV
jgi:hypothetical protein